MKEVMKNKYVRKFVSDFAHFFPLIIILVIGGILLVLFSFNVSYQAVTAGVVSLLYILWGIIHHAIHKDLDAVVVIEYVLVASLGLIIIYSMLFNV